MDARFRIPGHTKNSWPKQQQKTESEFQSHTVMWTMDRNRSWKAEGSIQANFGDIVIFSLAKKNIYIYIHIYIYIYIYIYWHKHGAQYTKMVSSLSGKSTYHTWSKTQRNIVSIWKILYTRVNWNDVIWKLKNCNYREIDLCYLLFLEVYTHQHFGLHCEEAAEE